MKCENCGKNDVSFLYRININGKVDEKHICRECAKKLGYLTMSRVGGGHDFDVTSSIMDGMRRSSGLMGRDFGMEMVDPMSMFLSTFGSGIYNYLMQNGIGNGLFSGIGRAEPDLNGKQDVEQADANTDDSFVKMRTINKLKAELKRAVQDEDFEHAAELKEKIKSLENQ